MNTRILLCFAAEHRFHFGRRAKWLLSRCHGKFAGRPLRESIIANQHLGWVHRMLLSLLLHLFVRPKLLISHFSLSTQSPTERKAFLCIQSTFFFYNLLTQCEHILIKDTLVIHLTKWHPWKHTCKHFRERKNDGILSTFDRHMNFKKNCFQDYDWQNKVYLSSFFFSFVACIIPWAAALILKSGDKMLSLALVLTTHKDKYLDIS